MNEMEATSGSVSME